MLNTKIQHQRFLGSGEDGFKVFLQYMGMVVILLKDAKLFEQFVNTPSIPLQQKALYEI